MSILENKKIGFVMTASCCTYKKAIKQIKVLAELGADVTPIFSYNLQEIDSRFGNAKEFMNEIEEICGKKALLTIPEVEPIGPKGYLDLLIIEPCSGNTLAKIANAIVDTPAVMAAKSMLRNGKPVVIAISSNDILGLNLKNIGTLINQKNIYFVPFGQDNFENKANSMIANFELTVETLEYALDNKQIQPIIVEY